MSNSPSIDEQDWWSKISQEDTTDYYTYDPDFAIWSDGFIPPPPRPPFLDDQITPDGLTTCDLCTWAFDKFTEDRHIENLGVESSITNSWVITLIVVSVMSALVGAVVMIVFLQCRSRLTSADVRRSFFCLGRKKTNVRDIESRNNEIINLEQIKEGKGRNYDKGKRVQSWLFINREKRNIPLQLSSNVNSTAASNHYTLDEGYTFGNDAVYSELNNIDEDRSSYRNNAYEEADNDLISSAPSSAYYSDISNQDRAYEIVASHTLPNWDPTRRPIIPKRPNNLLHGNYI